MIGLYILLGLALVVFFPLIAKWQPVADLLAGRHKDSSAVPPATVWVNTRSGLFYCKGSGEYARIQPGTQMKQADALQKGYQPAMHEFCKQ
jgi:hypothetical protein